MVRAHRLVEDTTIPDIGVFNTGIFVHSPEYGWVNFEAFPKNAASPGDTDLSAREEEGRKKIMAFKDELSTFILPINLPFSLMRFELS